MKPECQNLLMNTKLVDEVNEVGGTFYHKHSEGTVNGIVELKSEDKKDV